MTLRLESRAEFTRHCTFRFSQKKLVISNIWRKSRYFSGR